MPDLNPLDDDLSRVGNQFVFLANAWALMGVATALLILGLALIFHRQAGQVLGLAASAVPPGRVAKVASIAAQARS